MVSPSAAPSATPSAVLVEKILSEGPIGLSAAARRLGTFRSGAATHPATLVRWALQGAVLADGTTLLLETIWCNGRRITSWPAIVRFITAQQTRPARAAAPVAAARAGSSLRRGRSARAKAADAAAKALDAAGI